MNYKLPELKDYNLSIDTYNGYNNKLKKIQDKIDSMQLSEWKAFLIPMFIFGLLLTIFGAILEVDLFSSFFLVIVLASIFGAILRSDTATNLLTHGEYDRTKEEKEKFKDDFYQKIEPLEKRLKDDYQNALKEFFENKLYRKRSGSKEFEHNLGLFSEMIEKGSDLSRLLTTKYIHTREYEEYLKKREFDHIFSKDKADGTEKKLPSKSNQSHDRPIISPENEYSTIKKLNWEAINKSKIETGIKGEKIVVEIEKKYLEQLNKKDLANKVSHISIENGDGAGYDILSFFENGKEKFIEVKSTKNTSQSFFNISRNELNFLENNMENSFVYHLLDIDGNEPKLRIIPATKILNSNNIVPTQFIVKID